MDRTPHLNLPLPDPDEALAIGCQAIRTAFLDLDGKFAAIDALLASDDLSLDSVQEVVVAIKAALSDLGLLQSLLDQKSDRETVESALSGKADRTAVEQQLADLAHAVSDSQFAQQQIVEQSLAAQQQNVSGALALMATTTFAYFSGGQ